MKQSRIDDAIKLSALKFRGCSRLTGRWRMAIVIPLISILGTLAVGAVSPGPSFIMVSRVAISRSRADGLAAAVGLGIGGMLFALLALAGLAAILSRAGWFYLAFKVAGGAYLVYLALQIWTGARNPIDLGRPQPSRGSLVASFRTAVLTQLTNPKAIIVYASIFAAYLPRDIDLKLAIALPLGAFIVEAGWYALVALAFSKDRPRRLYLSCKRWIDRASAAILGILGARLIVAAIA